MTQQPMPVVRELNRAELMPQLFAIAFLTIAGGLCFPGVTILLPLIGAPLIYLIYCRSMRAIFVRDHTRGMRAYKAGQFQEAISHFQASRQFFSQHPRLDDWRSLIFGVASYNTYRVIALGNMAYCHAQLGDGNKAIELFEQVLREAPGHTGAQASLNMLKARPPVAGAN